METKANERDDLSLRTMLWIAINARVIVASRHVIANKVSRDQLDREAKDWKVMAWVVCATTSITATEISATINFVSLVDLHRLQFEELRCEIVAV